MTELVPFQEKRKKQFKKDTTANDAVGIELTKHLKRLQKDILFGSQKLEIDATAKVLDIQQVKELPSQEVFTELIASVTSPQLLKDTNIPWSLARLELPVLVLYSLSQQVTVKKLYQLLPKPYQKQLKRTYTAKATVDLIAENIGSAKRAKKYIRILQKRLGFYTQKKPPFKK